jgi:hypothetical protein
MQNAKCRMQNAECKMQNCRIAKLQNAELRIIRGYPIEVGTKLINYSSF